MRKKVSVLILLSFLFLSGCKSALLQTMRENDEAEQRISEKSSQLLNLEEQNYHLSIEKKNLVSKLNQKSIPLDELKAGLDRLKRENKKIRAKNTAEQKKKAALTKNLDQYLEEINALDADPHLSTQAKKDKIVDLKKEIAKELNKDY